VSDNQSGFRPTTPPNTPERLREIDAWMVQQNAAAVERLVEAVSDPQIRLRTAIADGLKKLASDNQESA
jgi:hypothetical protein